MTRGDSTLAGRGCGLGRTGTLSLKLALERLLGAPCYHMMEVFAKPEHLPLWHDAATRGKMPDWHELLRGYVAAVDWPVGRVLARARRGLPRRARAAVGARRGLVVAERERHDLPRAEHAPRAPVARNDRGLFAARFTSAISDREASLAAFERHNADVRERMPAHRLLEWRAGDGWAPICRGSACRSLPIRSRT